MTRLIDADELKQAEERIANLPWGDWQGHKVGFAWMPHEVQKLIDRSPTIDAVEVVKCKDCKHWHREIHNGIEYFNFSSCDLNHHGDGHNFYCADGERREPYDL